MQITTITADTQLTDIEKPLKLYAGPGAGKTRFMINHIMNVLHHSLRLGSTRKVACITYTNVGTETILKRLGRTADRVEVSTIHSFLYKHAIKPYIHLVPAEYELNYKLVDGHDDIVMSSYSFIDEWKTKTGQQRITDNSVIVAAWSALRWKFDMTGNLVINTPYPHKYENYSIKTASYLEYKKMVWAKGFLHHDDVLFFSSILIEKYPFLLDVLRAKFPYFFVDEFQDTNPIQVKILQKIAQRETVIGVIGDKAQSIYSFQGADPAQIDSFVVPEMDLYQIEDNHRSTNEIVTLLNHVRTQISQKGIRREQGMAVEIIIGDMLKAIAYAKEMCEGNLLYSLCRNNATSNSIRKHMNVKVGAHGLLDTLYTADSNRDRRSIMLGCIKAIEYARQGYFKDAIKELRPIPATTTKPEINGKRNALNILKKLLDNVDLFEPHSLISLHEFINNNIVALSKFSRGKAKDFYSGTGFKDISTAIKNLNEAGTERTIHKSKGDEFDNVIVVLDKEDDGSFKESVELGFLLAPNLDNEEHRIRYVGISRARDRLFINLPSLSDNSISFLLSKNITLSSCR